MTGGTLFGPVCAVGTVDAILRERHYLGPARRGWAWSDEHGVLVLANPSSRRLPHDSWLELIRWCLTGGPNAGSRQWSSVAAHLRAEHPDVTTVVSYSDPSAGHTGALYRACGWLWAPTWHRLREPPSGNGEWTNGERQAVKDRWIYPLRPDPARAGLLAVNDEALARRFPALTYHEPSWRSGRFTTARPELTTDEVALCASLSLPIRPKG